MPDKPDSTPQPVLQIGPATPVIPSSTFSAAWTSNDCYVFLGRPDLGAKAGEPGEAAAFSALALAVLQLSPQSTKDLYLVLKDTVEAYERAWGEIHTDFTRRAQAARAND